MAEEQKDARVAEAVEHIKSLGFSQKEAEDLVAKNGTHTILADKESGAGIQAHYGTPKNKPAAAE